MMTRGAISNIWYGSLVGADMVSPAEGSHFARAIAGIRMFRRSRAYSTIITSEGRMKPAGMVALMFLLALTRSRKLVVMEFLPGRKTGVLGTAVALAYRALLHRVCLYVQVMTAEEEAIYAERYRIPRGLLRHVPYYFLDDRSDPAHSVRRGVLSSGYQSCDWDSLLDAAEGMDWDLTIVCSVDDASRIRERSEQVGVKLRSDISRGEHDELLRSAALYVICLKDDAVSAGHTRLMSALTARTPTVLSDVTGAIGYSQLASTLVPPGDVAALRRAIDVAVKDPEVTNVALQRALDIGRTWTYTDYSAKLSHDLGEVIAR